MNILALTLVLPRCRILAGRLVLGSLIYSSGVYAQSVDTEKPEPMKTDHSDSSLLSSGLSSSGLSSSGLSNSGLSSSGLSSSGLSNSGLSNYSLGVEAYRKGEFRSAFDAWSLGAYEGDNEAQYNLGVLYLEGRGVERNLEQARNWFIKAAQKQHLEAQYNLGHMALSGMGMEEDTDAALKWWQQAAEGGYAQAQFNYGRALYLGVGGRQDQHAGLELIRAAAAQHDQRAQKFLDQNTGNQEGKSERIAVVSVEPTPVAVVDKQAKQSQNTDEANPVAKLEQPQPQPESKVVEYEPGRVKLEIVRDQAEVRKDYFLRTVARPVPVYALPDLSSQLDMVNPQTLVKVLSMEADKLKIEVVTGLLVWAKEAGLEQRDGLAKATLSGLTMYQSPGGPALGELPQNMNLKVLEQQGAWLKLNLPQQIYGWINARSLAYSGESNQLLRLKWAQQMNALKGYPQHPDKVGLAQVKAETSVQIKQRPLSLSPAPAPAPAVPVSQSQTVENTAMSINDNTWLFTQAKGAYAVHVFTLLDHARAMEIAAKQRYRSKAKLFTTQAKYKTWSFLLLGPYADIDTAKAARSRLPSYLAKSARIRSIELMAENRCKKRFQLQENQARGLDAFCLN